MVDGTGESRWVSPRTASTTAARGPARRRPKSHTRSKNSRLNGTLASLHRRAAHRRSPSGSHLVGQHRRAARLARNPRWLRIRHPATPSRRRGPTPFGQGHPRTHRSAIRVAIPSGQVPRCHPASATDDPRGVQRRGQPRPHDSQPRPSCFCAEGAETEIEPLTVADARKILEAARGDATAPPGRSRLAWASGEARSSHFAGRTSISTRARSGSGESSSALVATWMYRPRCLCSAAPSPPCRPDVASPATGPRGAQRHVLPDVPVRPAIARSVKEAVCISGSPRVRQADDR